MSASIAINIILGLLALIGILAVSLWAIRTATADDIGQPPERRRRPDRRRRVVPEFPARAERRRDERRRDERRRSQGTATA